MMFNDRYGLTQAVISGRKTVTRRIVDPQGKYEELRWWQPCLEFEECLYGYTENEGWEVIEPRYNVGEIVAVAQRYDRLSTIIRPPHLRQKVGITKCLLRLI